MNFIGKLLVAVALLSVWGALAYFSFRFVQSLALPEAVAAVALFALLFLSSFIVLYPALALRVRYRHRRDIRQLKHLLSEGDVAAAEALLQARARRAGLTEAQYHEIIAGSRPASK